MAPARTLEEAATTTLLYWVWCLQAACHGLYIFRAKITLRKDFDIAKIELLQPDSWLRVCHN
jgi:hypothetical protein